MYWINDKDFEVLHDTKDDVTLVTPCQTKHNLMVFNEWKLFICNVSINNA